MFDKHLRTLLDAYSDAKILAEGEKKMLIKLLIDCDTLMAQQGLFKMCMKSNSCYAVLPPYDVNPLTKVWRVFDSNNNLTQNFKEFLKLVEMGVVHVIGLVEDERTFSNLSFLKSKLQDNLEEHIQVVIDIYSQCIFTLENFPYKAILDEWFLSSGHNIYGKHLGICTLKRSIHES